MRLKRLAQRDTSFNLRKFIAMTNQDQLKLAVAKAALRYIVPGEIVGVGTGSTANLFIDELAKIKGQIKAAVASSDATAKRLSDHGIPVLDLNQVSHLPVYIDGADEITAYGAMIKGGGAALTREKIVASVAEKFVCIADASKLVLKLGKFPLPVEVIPMAYASVSRQLQAIGGVALLREKDGKVVVTDNGNYLLDWQGMQFGEPKVMEAELNNIPGVVTVGLFALRGANVCLLGTPEGVETLRFN